MSSINPQTIATRAADTVSVGAIAGTFVHILPPFAAFIAIVWYVIQIWESQTVQKMMADRKRGRGIRKGLEAHHHKHSHPPEELTNAPSISERSPKGHSE